ncbi:family 20 glycosylhydrolase [Winogradskyella sp. SYSU M77433]|uniref:beta-N-acetylhexosaminidase n=1 Tax=Winogradskyella sp. SYSU M77433 TaxID=3042722 RepID=UPI0024808C90|nr:family 20 glycosylhydrolase [Winogradskyella sp. SYSU M77433]MDH7913331.1 family 20 glycosylhydrolase [Winogradskyella sp. SYSU M77433]
MHIKKLISLFILSLIFVNCNENSIQTIQPQIIPIPDSVELTDSFFTIDESTGITYDDNFKVSAQFLKDFIESGSSIHLKEGTDIKFKLDENLKPEAYHLTVSKEGITIKASTDQGAFYAVQSLRQIMPVDLENDTFSKNEINIQAVTIRDQPQFKYRGMHLDVARHMFSVDFIKKYIDALVLLKMNTFHWHLTDDQGWRIEIKKYPKLQEVSAYRDETLVGHYSDQPHQFDGKRYGGYYTQEEVKAVVQYAKARFVTVIPEIEMPGHAQAAIAAYPELGCTDEPVEVAKKWGVFEEIYCPNQKTFAFLEDVLDEVLELFPSKYIHIGGDEAPKTRWKNCEHCQKLIKKEGLKDEHHLQSYFITKMEAYLNSKGRQIIGWDEILEGGLAPNATVMSWRGTNGAVEAAKSGHNVVMTPTSHCYFDYYQSENEDEPLAIGGFLPLEKVYGFNPIPEELTIEESKYVLGAQGNIWTEYIPTEKHLEYMTFPRMLALSEVVWSQPQHKNYKDFVSRLENFHQRLNALDINYANHLYEIEGDLISDEGKSYYELKTLTEGKSVRYTLDGSEPTINSKVYESKIPITESSTIKAAVYNDEKQLGKTFTQYINYHKAVGAKITIDKQPHKAYSGSGAEGLINGISGSDSRYGDKEWLGFWGEDIEITIDFKEPIKIDSIETRFYDGNGQWIYTPEHIAIRIIFDNDEVIANKFLPESSGNPNLKNVFWEQSILSNRPIKRVKLLVPNYGIIPEGKQGAGNKAWTFIDEIIVN